VTDFQGVDVNKPNRAVYDAALRQIANGNWSADPERGLLFGVRNAPFRGKRPGSKGGYVVCKPDGRHLALVHRILWESVNGAIPDGLEINHINGVKDDNRISNLEAVTHAENMKHAYTTGLMQLPPTSQGRRAKTSCPKHGTDSWRMRKDGSRFDCLACKREHSARVRAA
jgi:hypothetical protein